ncbi:MAG: SRPBCC family protein [Actinomycetota bacterium]
MAAVFFTVNVPFDAPARTVWDELIDWKGHEEWIPATRVRVDDDDPTAVGATFTAWTGFGRLSLEDRMRVTELAWDDSSGSGRCEVEKLGPILTGRAGFDVRPSPSGNGSEVEWLEDVQVRWLPSFLAPIVERLGAIGFKRGMQGLAKKLATTAPASTATTNGDER